MIPQAHFAYCPRCAQLLSEPRTQRLECHACGFLWFFNPVPSASVIIQRENGEVLLIRRAREPARSKLAPPGGIIEAGESAEAAAKREILEEVGMILPEVSYLCSSPGVYSYAGVDYPVIDFFFTAQTTADIGNIQAEEIAECFWIVPKNVTTADLAFDSVREAWTLWRERFDKN